MYPVYKNTYKRLFCPNKKALKGEKVKGLDKNWCFLPSSPKEWPPAGFGNDDQQENASQFNNNF